MMFGAALSHLRLSTSGTSTPTAHVTLIRELAMYVNVSKINNKEIKSTYKKQPVLVTSMSKPKKGLRD